MNSKLRREKLCYRILEDNGGAIADKTRTILLEDPALRDLQSPLKFLSKTWRDPLIPAMMSLSCKAVGGDLKETHDAGAAMSLINLSFRVWDDMIDKARVKSFKPTLYGKFGEGTALIIGGLASAKAFSILEQMDIDYKKRMEIDRLLWNFLSKMAKAETRNIKMRSQPHPSSKEKFRKIKAEAVDLETCMKIGAILGNGSHDEIFHLGKYGESLGIILELWNDFQVSTNLTLELIEKIESKAFPYALMWASERSESLKYKLESFSVERNEQIYIKEVVEDTLGAGTFSHTFQMMREAAKEGVKAVTKLEFSRPSIQTLQSFIEAQPQLFFESLPALKTT